MPPKTTSTLSCSTSLAAFAAATASSVALSSRYSSRCRPSRPPLALMSPMTILATLALASPTNESGPVWSAMTPTLMGSAPGVGDAAMMSSLELSVSVCAVRQQPRVVRGSCSRRVRPIHREDSPSWTHRFASVSSSPRWRSRRTTRSASRSSRSCGRACSRRGSARPRGSTRRCARPPTGWRCCATSAAPATPTRSPPCSATRSRFAPRRSSTTPRIPPR